MLHILEKSTAMVGPVAGAANFAPIRAGMEARRQRYGTPHLPSELQNLPALAQRKGPSAIDAFAQAQPIYARLNPDDRRKAEKWMRVIRRNYLQAWSQKGFYLRTDLVKANYIVPARGRIGWRPEDRDFDSINRYTPPMKTRRYTFGDEPGEMHEKPDPQQASPKKPKVAQKEPGPLSDFDLDHPKALKRLVETAHKRKFSERDIHKLSQALWPGYEWQDADPEHVQNEVVGGLMDLAEHRISQVKND